MHNADVVRGKYRHVFMFKVQQENELRKLRTDLASMKTQKVDLMKQFKKETSVFRKNTEKKEK